MSLSLHATNIESLLWGIVLGPRYKETGDNFVCQGLIILVGKHIILDYEKLEVEIYCMSDGDKCYWNIKWYRRNKIARSKLKF